MKNDKYFFVEIVDRKEKSDIFNSLFLSTWRNVKKLATVRDIGRALDFAELGEGQILLK